MNAQEFYRGLRPEDQEPVRRVADALKQKGFDVFATGSSLQGREQAYTDVDIVAKPALIPTETLERNIESALRTVTPRFVINPMRKMCYASSEVVSRCSVLVDGTLVDVSVSYRPFELFADARRVQL